jgi:threonine aldolase
MRYFLSDNTATAAPELMEAVVACNKGAARGYGADAWTARLTQVFSRFFEKDCAVFPVSTGTAANSLALATLCPPWGSVLCHEEAHIERDECGAPEFFSSGAKLTLIAGEGAKITPDGLERSLALYHPMVHMVQPRALSLTQATELGCVYTPNEVRALSRLAQARGLRVHMDGARFANALVTLGCTPADMTWRAGVDVLCFGATKNGALAAEAVVFFNLEDVADFEFRRKRAGHLLCKSRYTSAQLLAYLETGVWQRNAQRANSLAAQIGAALPELLLYPVEANEVFLNLGVAKLAALRAQGFDFYDWGSLGSGHARFVVSWDQPEEDVPALVRALKAAS